MDKAINPEELSKTQYASAENFRARAKLRDYAVPKYSTYEAGIEHLDLTGDEDVLEVGCGDGSVLVRLGESGHRGRLVGIDISKGMFAESASKAKDIEFIAGSADRIDFPDSSFDIILSFYMIYHMPDIPKALMEWKRLLSPRGKLLVVTPSGTSLGKYHERRWEIEKELGKSQPRFSERFNLENGEAQLAPYFKVVDRFVYNGEIRLKSADPLIAAWTSKPSLWSIAPDPIEIEAGKRLLRSTIDEEIAANGYFRDDFVSGFWICIK